MSTPAPKPYTPQQVLNNLRNFIDQLDKHSPSSLYVIDRCENIIARGIEPATTLPTCPGSLLDTLANVTAALDNVLLHHQHMPASDLYQRRLLVASTKHTLQQHGITI